MESIDYIGLDVDKKTVSYCVKTAGGEVRDEGTIAATKEKLTAWAEELERPWVGALEATLFTGWIYDRLEPYAQELKVGHPLMLWAITASKKKNDTIDASTIADLLRCDLFPECYMAPRQIRDLRRVLRFRNMIVQQGVRMKNKVAGLLMEVGEPYTKGKLYGRRYFAELLGSLEDVPELVLEMLELSYGTMEMFHAMQKRLIQGLRKHPELRERVWRRRAPGSSGGRCHFPHASSLAWRRAGKRTCGSQCMRMPAAYWLPYNGWTPRLETPRSTCAEGRWCLWPTG
ncbi:MAG: transposase, partial [Armatimonadota bacterium]